jgi:hypothetical protein
MSGKTALPETWGKLIWVLPWFDMIISIFQALQDIKPNDSPVKQHQQRMQFFLEAALEMLICLRVGIDLSSFKIYPAAKRPLNPNMRRSYEGNQGPRSTGAMGSLLGDIPDSERIRQ